MSSKLLLHQELLLLVLNDRKGTFQGSFFLYGMAGAMLSELLLQERIAAVEDKTQTISIISSESTGDPILDELLTKISSSNRVKGMRDWVYEAAKLPNLQHRVARQLVEKGILNYDEKKVLWLFTQKTYPELNGSYEDAIRSQMSDVMFNADFYAR